LLAAGGALAGSLAFPRSVHAAGSDTLKVGLIGCGGRGTGAAAQALNADSNAKLTAIADAFADRLESSLSNLKAEQGSKIDIADDHKFVGFDAYKQLLATDVDVVLLATPPHFRPIHFKAAIDAGKHTFVEKPVAVDAPGVRSVLATAEAAKAKNLVVVSGLCYRYDLPKRELVKRVHDGAIGDVRAMHVSYNTGTLWHHDRQPSWSEMEYQLRNWLYFTWLSGDFNVEQHVHSLDKAAWIMGDEPPVRATGLGGRQVRTGEEWGHIYDHMAVIYEYANGTRLFSNCRQMGGCSVDVSDHLLGTKGSAEMMSATIDGETPWKYSGAKPNMYDQEHKELFASIRSGSPINNGLYMARSTMLGIMGRMACYTGQTLTWDQCLNSKEDLSPASYTWGDAPKAAIAKPGLTQFA
jgi:myo-inositol 2-dehydrogenase / D-chiro-inositol 1-dehydrogenase